MVLEFIVEKELKKPVNLLLTGILLSCIAIVISLSLFVRTPSLVLVAFMTLPAIYIFTKLFEKESTAELKAKTTLELIKKNKDVIEMYTILFIGMSIGIALWYAFMPRETLSVLFSEQLYNLNQLGVSTGFYTSSSIFNVIVENNAKLVLLSAALSFIFGAGALYILSWNASVVGSAVGTLIYGIRTAESNSAIGLLKGLGLGAAFYILHLIPEVIAYFNAAIAGAIISVAIMRYQPLTKHSNKLIFAGLFLIALSLILIVFAAMLEVGISHQIQSILNPARGL